jgi:hypothetical protein
MPEKKEDEIYDQAIKFLCHNQQFKIQSFDDFTKELTAESYEKFKKLIIELSIIKQKIVDLPCNNEINIIDFDFNLSFVIGSRKFYQKIDQETLEFQPTSGCEL